MSFEKAWIQLDKGREEKKIHDEAFPDAADLIVRDIAGALGMRRCREQCFRDLGRVRWGAL